MQQACVYRGDGCGEVHVSRSPGASSLKAATRAG